MLSIYVYSSKFQWFSALKVCLIHFPIIFYYQKCEIVAKFTVKRRWKKLIKEINIFFLITRFFFLSLHSVMWLKTFHNIGRNINFRYFVPTLIWNLLVVWTGFYCKLFLMKIWRKFWNFSVFNLKFFDL